MNEATAAESDPNSPNMGQEELRNAQLFLLLVGAAYFVAELVLFSMNRGISWDEAVYLSQVTPGMEALPFVASRARGITVLAWPVVQLGGALPAVRLLLAVGSAIALAAAYRPWAAVIGFSAPLAAVALGSTWVGLLYGSEVMPNLWAALLAVSSIGVLARSFTGQGTSRWGLLLATALLALLSLFRPPDAIPVILAIAAVATWTQALSFRRIALLTLGAIAGWIPWVVEMSVRLGGPLEALSQAQETAHAGTASLGSRFVQHLAVSNGPTIGPTDHPHVPIGGVVWWGALLVLAIIGVLRAEKTPTFPLMLASTLAGLGLAAEYLLFVSGIAPRFLLPSYALLSVPAASALRSLYQGLGWRPARWILLVVIVGPWFVWQIDTADRIEAQTDVSRRSLEEVGLSLRQAAAGRPCSFASTDSFPQIEYVSGCDGRRLRDDTSRQIADLELAAAGERRVYLVSHRAVLPESDSSTIRLTLSLPAPGGRTWLIQELVMSDEGEGITDEEY